MGKQFLIASVSVSATSPAASYKNRLTFSYDNITILLLSKQITIFPVQL